MRLISKVNLALIATVTVSVLLNFWVLQSIVLPRFQQLDEQATRTNAQRVLDAVSNEVQHLYGTVQDWAHWDDTYNFVQGKKPDYIENNLYYDTLASLEMNLFYILDQEGTVVWGRIFDLESGEQVPVEEFPADRLPPEHPLRQHESTNSLIGGVYKTSAGPMLVASTPILNNEKKGPVVGTFIIGRIFDEARLAALKEQVQVDFSIHLVDQADPALITELQAAAGQRKLFKGAPYRIGPPAGTENRNVLSVYALVPALSGTSNYVLQATKARDIWAAGKDTVLTALGMLMLVGLIVLATIWLLLRRIAIDPLSRLSDAVTEIGRTGDLTRKTGLDRQDEIGILSSRFDETLDGLRQARELLLEQSYYGGMAESAAGILHNIRNTVSPLTIRVNSLHETLELGRGSRVIEALDELKAGRADENRRNKLLEYVDRATRDLHGELSDGVALIQTHANHIDDILTEHEDISRAPKVEQQVEISQAIREAAALISTKGGISVSFDLPNEMGQIVGNSVVVTQVIGNLLLNACEAIEAAGVEDGAVTLNGEVENDRGKPVLHMTISDNGEGIDADRLVKIFERGYSTRKEKSGGLGLHWCANSVSAMGGSLRATSDGPGKGAAFHVYLPLAEQEKVEAA